MQSSQRFFSKLGISGTLSVNITVQQLYLIDLSILSLKDKQSGVVVADRSAQPFKDIAHCLEKNLYLTDNSLLFSQKWPLLS